MCKRQKQSVRVEKLEGGRPGVCEREAECKRREAGGRETRCV